MTMRQTDRNRSLHGNRQQGASEAEKRDTKLKRRSFLQKSKRDQVVNKHRDLPAVKESSSRAAGLELKARMKEWKKERERKKAMEKRKLKPTFKVVTQMERNDNKLYYVSHSQNEHWKATGPSRNTRSKTLRNKDLNREKPSPAMKQKKQDSQSKVDGKKRKNIAKAQAKKESSSSKTRKSFAPAKFAFKAPDGLPAMNFDDTIPNSMASFIYNKNLTTMNFANSTPGAKLTKMKQKILAPNVLTSDSSEEDAEKAKVIEPVVKDEKKKLVQEDESSAAISDMISQLDSNGKKLSRSKKKLSKSNIKTTPEKKQRKIKFLFEEEADDLHSQRLRPGSYKRPRSIRKTPIPKKMPEIVSDTEEQDQEDKSASPNLKQKNRRGCLTGLDKSNEIEFSFLKGIKLDFSDEENHVKDSNDMSIDPKYLMPCQQAKETINISLGLDPKYLVAEDGLEEETHETPEASESRRSVVRLRRSNRRTPLAVLSPFVSTSKKRRGKQESESSRNLISFSPA